MTVATFNDRLYGVPLYADVSALFYNKDLFEQAGPRPEQAADEPGRAPRVRGQDHGARRRHQGLLPAGQLRRLQHLHGRPADVGVRTRRSRPASAATSRSTGDGVKEVLQWTRDMVKAGNVPESARRRDRRHVPPPVRLRQDRDDGHGQLQHHARQRPDGERATSSSSASPTCPGTDAGLVRVVHRRRPRRRPERQRPRRRRRRVHEVHPVGQRAGRGLRQAAQPDDPQRHGRQQVLPGRAARPGRGQGARGRAARRTP